MITTDKMKFAQEKIQPIIAQAEEIVLIVEHFRKLQRDGVVEKKMIKKSFENFEDVIPFITELYKGYHRTIKKAKFKAIGVIECSL